MCGVAGFITREEVSIEAGKKILTAMNQSIAHRGPDASGDYIDIHKGIFLTHRRLSILDLSTNGNQPMFSKSGNLCIVFNGEIYNHEAIRKELDVKFNIIWKGNSDTETLLESIERLGIEKTLQNCRGMFAFGLYDLKSDILTLVRDRMGEKPLFYGSQGGNFFFASELKALQDNHMFKKKLNKRSLYNYLAKGYVTSSDAIWEDIRRLEPGSIAVFKFKNKTLTDTTIKPYWSFEEIALQGQKNQIEMDSKSIENELTALLTESISDQMLSDVPLGAFLSGGIDSSLVVAIMQSISTDPINTFSIGFENKDYNEAPYAKAISDYLSTNHTEIYLSEKDLLDVIPILPEIYDEPFGDSSAIPTYLVSKLAKSKVSVSLSGDGGDELFGGYSRYKNKIKENMWSTVRSLPNFLLSPTFALMSNIKLPKNKFGFNIKNKIRTLNDYRDLKDFPSFYYRSTCQWPKPPILNETIHQNFINTNIDANLDINLEDSLHKMMAIDSLTYLPNDILTKVDRAGMSVSLETRVPFLDKRVVEFAWKLPKNLKIKNGNSKWILKKILNNYLPSHLTERPKKGFSVPIGSWLRGPLRDWSEYLLDEQEIKEEGIFDWYKVKFFWDSFLMGDERLSQPIWILLMFRAWSKRHF